MITMFINFKTTAMKIKVLGLIIVLIYSFKAYSQVCGTPSTGTNQDFSYLARSINVNDRIL